MELEICININFIFRFTCTHLGISNNLTFHSYKITQLSLKLLLFTSHLPPTPRIYTIKIIFYLYICYTPTHLECIMGIQY